jgi:hypothetical protein
MPDVEKELSVGDMCLLDKPSWSSQNIWPQVAKVLSIDGDSVVVRW